MENENVELLNYKIGFKGKVSKFTGMALLNYLLVIITLGFYSPWAIVKLRSYLYSVLDFEGAGLVFTATGKQMFGSYLKFFFLLLVSLAVVGVSSYYFMEYIGIAFMYMFLLALTPLLIHSSLRYTLSNTTWKGIRFAYEGNRKEFILNYLQWTFFTIITLGIYQYWMHIKMYRYIVNNIRIGNMEIRFKGREYEFFKIAFFGTLLSLVTLGVYSFWMVRKLIHYYVNNTTFYKDGLEIRFKSTLTIKETFTVTITNALIAFFTLGLGMPIVLIRRWKMILNNIEAEGTIDLYSVQPVYNDVEETYDIFDFKL